MTTNNELDALLDEVGSGRGQAHAWERWPEDAHRLIARACELNDSGIKNTSVRGVIEALAKLGVEANATMIQRYATKRLSRKTWRQK